MKFNLSNPFEIQRAKTYLNSLIEKHAKIELLHKREKRTLSQNALFHLWLRVFQDHTGELNFEDVKRDVKRTLLGVREVVNKFTGEVTTDDYRTSEMNTKQLSSFMEKFKMWADMNFGCYLPSPDDVGFEDMINEYDYK